MRVSRQALRVTAFYALFGAAWMVFSDRIVLALAPDLLGYASVRVWKGLAFVLASALALYLVTDRLTKNTASPPSAETPDASLGAFMLVFSILACAIILLGLGGIAYTANSQKAKEIERLKTIADLKSGQIVAWLDQRHENAKVIRSDDLLTDLHRAWRISGDEASRTRLAARLEMYREAFNYQDILMLEGDRVIIQTAGGDAHPVTPVLQEAARRAIATGRILSSDLYRTQSPMPSHVHLDFVAPLRAGNDHSGLVIVLRADPNRFLFPFIQSWPVPSASAETLLFRRDDNDVLFLNELRHRTDTALRQRVPLTVKNLLAVQVLNGSARTGDPVEGVDYRNVPVLGVVKAIEGTQWFLVAKLDKDELYALAKRDAGWIILAVTLSLIVAAAALRLLHQRQELRYSLIQRRQQAEKLQALELLDSIAEGSTDAIYAKDAGGRYLFLNRELSRFTGKARSEVLGRDDTAIFQPVDAERLMNCDRQVMEDGQAATSEEMLRTTTGIRTFLTTRGPLHDAEHKVVGVFGIARDITERKQQEREIRASEARFRAIFDGVNDAIFLHDALTGSVLDVNAKMTEMYGYGRKEARRLSIGDLSANTPPYTNEEAMNWFARAQRGETPVFEWLARRRDGNLFWVEISMRRAEIAGRACVLVLARDIGERMQAEAALQERISLREQIGKLSLAVDNSPVSIMITDTSGIIEYVNQHFTQVTGYVLEEVLGHNPRILRSDETPRAVHQQLWECIAAGREWAGELQNRKKSGELFWEYERIIPIRDANGTITNFLAIREDITKRKQSEEAIRRLTERQDQT